MIHGSCEVVAFQEVMEMLHCQVKGEKLVVESAILPLGRSKKSYGCHEPSMSCSRTTPTATPDASTVTAMGRWNGDGRAWWLPPLCD